MRDNVRQLWQAFHRVISATATGLVVVDGTACRQKLEEARRSFISQSIDDGNIASKEFKTLADAALADSLTGCDDLDDNVVISRLGRATLRLFPSGYPSRAWGIPSKDLTPMLEDKERIESSGFCQDSP